MASDEARLKAMEFGKSHYKEYRNFSEATCLQDGYLAGYTQGRADALKELEQLQREAFESGHKAKVREEYNSALIKNGFVSAAGRYKDVDEAFNDYLSSKSKEGAE